jgi:hypothetical protein
MSPPKEAKDTNGQAVAVQDATGAWVPKVVSYKNERWNRRVHLADLVQAGVTDDILVKAFGSPEAVNAAIETEKLLDKMCL